MKQEIIDLLNHPDQANRLIGCWLAWHNGYGTIEIFDELKEQGNGYTTKLYNLNNIMLKIAENRAIKHGNYGRTKMVTTGITFMILELHPVPEPNKILKILTIKQTNPKKQLYKNTFRNFKHMFMEYVLTE